LGLPVPLKSYRNYKAVSYEGINHQKKGETPKEAKPNENK
jgi:hypothetical protein